MAKCRRFFQCEEHWNADELADMQPLPPVDHFPGVKKMVNPYAMIPQEVPPDA
jgi:hypothetical protein